MHLVLVIARNCNKQICVRLIRSTKMSSNAKYIDDDGAKKKRLQYLLKQTELFNNFMSRTGHDQVDNENLLSKSKIKKRSHRTDDSKVMYRFDSTPNYITNGEMRDYQLRGLNWMISQYHNGINGILADEMGLGKTLQTISLLGYLLNFLKIPGPHIVVAPKSTLLNWMNEFKHWCPSLKTVCLIGNADERYNIFKNDIKDTSKFNVLVTSYEMCIRERSRLSRLSWNYLVLDEGHRIKNEKTQLARNLRTFKSANRLLLTGTPLQNNLHELWALLNFLLPDIFHSSEDFDDWFNTDNCLGDATLIERLHGILKPFVLRRIKAEVEKSLKPKKETKIYVGLSKMQREWYRNILLKHIDVLNNFGQTQKKGLDQIIMHLRKCTSHPYLFDSAEQGPPYTTDTHLVTNSGKMVVLDKLLPKLKAQGSRVLIFCQFIRTLDILEDYCNWRGYENCRLDGQDGHEDRQHCINDFNALNSTKFIFMLSTRAGGLGINLATADVVIFYDSDWNPQIDLQAMDRAHRIGQKKEVRVFRLITDNTIDVRLDEVATTKLRLDKMIIQQGKFSDHSSSLKRAEMFDMVRYGANYILSSQESDITDDDIDKILAVSEDRTAQQEKKLASLGESELRAFALDTVTSKSLYEFEGEDFREKLKGDESDVWINLPKHRRARNDDHLKYMDVQLANKPALMDFQFYSPRLFEIIEKETNYFRKLNGCVVPIGLCKNANDQRRKQRCIDEAQMLTEEELTEKKHLLSEGFGNWSRMDKVHYIRTLVKFGRNDMVTVVNNVIGKTPEEVMRYHDVFWKRYRELNNSTWYKSQVEKGEAKLRAQRELVEENPKILLPRLVPDSNNGDNILNVRDRSSASETPIVPKIRRKRKFDEISGDIENIAYNVSTTL